MIETVVGVLSNALKWFGEILRSRKEKQIGQLTERVRIYFEQGQASLHGRFCPSREDVRQAAGGSDLEDIDEAPDLLKQRGIISYNGGRYYLN